MTPHFIKKKLTMPAFSGWPCSLALSCNPPPKSPTVDFSQFLKGAELTGSSRAFAGTLIALQCLLPSLQMATPFPRSPRSERASMIIPPEGRNFPHHCLLKSLLVTSHLGWTLSQEAPVRTCRSEEQKLIEVRHPQAAGMGS